MENQFKESIESMLQAYKAELECLEDGEFDDHPDKEGIRVEYTDKIRRLELILGGNKMSMIFKDGLNKDSRGLAKAMMDQLDLEISDDIGHEQRVILLWGFMKLTDLMGALGWQEYTANWDPFFEFELKDGTRLETMNGYHEMRFPGFDDDTTLCVDYAEFQVVEICNVDKGEELGEDENGGWAEVWTEFKIDDIKSIRVER